MGLTSNIKDNDFVSIRQSIAKLGSAKLGVTSSPTYAGLTITGLTASQFVMTDASKSLASLAVPLTVTYGGTGLTTITNHGLLLGSGTDAITPLGVATHGQLPIGSTGADPVLATLTGTANEIDVTNAAGSITLSLSASLSLSGATIGGDLIPEADGTYDIGSYSAEVSGTLKDYHNVGDTSLYGIIDATNWKGQSFTAGSNYDISSVKLLMYKAVDKSPGTVTVSIRATTGVNPIPTGDDLAVGTINGNDLTEDTDGEWIRITFDAAYSLVSGTVYAICVRCAGTNPDVIYLREDDTAGYAAGNQCYSSTTGNSWLADIDDCMFETYSGSSETESLAINDIYFTGDISDGTYATSAAEIAAAYAHVSSDGTDHTYIDQDLRIAASPTFAGLTIVNAITEFSTDGTLAGDSDSALPTEKAVKTYVDAATTSTNNIISNPGAAEYGVRALRLSATGDIIVTYDGDTGGYVSSIVSCPGATEHRIKALRRSASGAVVVTYDSDVGGGSGLVQSLPTSGEYQIKALRLSADLALIVTYDGDAEE